MSSFSDWPSAAWPRSSSPARPGPEGFDKAGRGQAHPAAPRQAARLRRDVPRRGAHRGRARTTRTSCRSTTSASRRRAYYLAMEYLHGEDVRSLVRGAPRDEARRCRSSDALTIFIAACDGAAPRARDGGSTGAARIVHRDVTPQNMLVSYDGAVKLARLRHRQGARSGVAAQTNAGTLKGKVAVHVARAGARRAARSAQRSVLARRGGVGAAHRAAALPAAQRARHAARGADVRRAVDDDGEPGYSAAARRRHRDGARAGEPADRWENAAEFAHALSAWMGAAGESPSKSRLAATMARLFGSDAGERKLAAATAPTEATDVERDFVADDGTSEPRVSPLHPERWIPQIAMHLHLPPPRMPPCALVGPLLALLLRRAGCSMACSRPRASRALGRPGRAPAAPAL